jgi:hypothetical protein
MLKKGADRERIMTVYQNVRDGIKNFYNEMVDNPYTSVFVDGLVAGSFAVNAGNSFIKGMYVQGAIFSALALSFGAIGIASERRRKKKMASLEKELKDCKEKLRSESGRN